MRSVIVVGAGGHGKVVVSALQAQGCEIRAIFDDDSAKWGQTLLGLPISGPIDRLGDSDPFPVIIALGSPTLRMQLAERFTREWATVIHPTAFVHDSVTIGPGTVVFAGAVIQPGTQIGAHVIINTSSSIDHDCMIADFVNVGPGAHLASTVHVARGADLCTGATIIPSILIGELAVVGAGATVIRDVPSFTTVVGCPAQPIHRRSNQRSTPSSLREFSAGQ
jgi:sugar O-acyltransferase (sialic acid O-acetyltransferase NeuD family)